MSEETNNTQGAEDQNQAPEFNKEEAINKLQSDGFVVRTKEEESKFAANLQNEMADFNRQKGKFFEDLENDASKYFGVEKQDGEGAFSLFKRGLRTFADQKPQQQEEQPKDVIPKSDFEAAITERERELEELRKQNEELNKSIFGSKVNSDLGKSFESRKFAIPSHIQGEEEAKEYTKQQRELIQTHFLNTYKAKEVDGRIVYEKDGEVLKNKRTLEPLSAEDIINQQYKGYFATPEQVKGTGTKGSSSKSAPSFTSRVEVAEYLQTEEGLKVGSPTFNKRMQELSNGLAINS